MTDNNELIYWRATFYSSETPDMQITIEFQAPAFNSEIDYELDARLAMIAQVRDGELIKVKDVEPIERR